MPKFLEVSDTAAARDAIGLSGVVLVSHHVEGAASYEAAISAAITEAGANGVVDFEGVSYVTTGTVTIATNGVTLTNGGITPTGQIPALAVNADDVTVENMTFSRSTSAPYDQTTSQRACVVVNGERFTSHDCDYLASAGACVYLTHAECNGAVIRGGRMTGTASFQNASGVYAAAGSTGNQNITVENVHLHDITDGVLLFDTGSSLVKDCRVEACRAIPTIELTGWTLVAGDIYRQRTASGSTPGTDGPSTDRVEGNTGSVYVNGAHIGEVTQGSTSPTANRASVSGGYVYINLGGTNPNTQTITSKILSGYAFLSYLKEADPEVMSGNRFVGNYADDVDGFGLYFQMSNDGGCYGNQAIGNHFTNVCLEGSQNASLPFGGIGVIGGTDTLLALNTIDGVGSSGKTVPGVTIFPGTTNTDPSGRMIGMTVRGSLNVGYSLRASNWIVQGCRADDNANHGFYIYETAAGATVEGITLSGCLSQNNTGVGMFVDGTSTSITNMSVNIVGGASIGNGNRGIQISGSSAGTTVSGCSVIGVLVKENGTSSQQIILSGAAEKITVAGCNMIHSGSSTGLYVAATVANVVAVGNQFDISTPKTYLAAVTSGIEDSTTAALGVGTLELGHASDTTLSRSAAGTLAVEGVEVPTISSTSTLTNKTLTDPKVSSIKDTNGNNVIGITATASAVNYFQVENKAASGGGIGLYAVGSDTSIPIVIWSKGTSGITFRSLAAGVFFSATPVSSGVNYIAATSAVTTANPAFTATGSDTNIGINLVPKGSGAIQIGGNPASAKVSVPANASAAGKPGQWAADSSYIYTYTGDGTSHTWVRASAASW